MRVRRKST